MTGLLRRASLRFYLRHPWQLGLAVAGISLGVGVYVGVSLANDSAARAFDVTAADVRGPLTHRLLPLDSSLDERIYSELLLRDGTLTAAPVVEAEVGIAQRPDLRVPLLGLDPIRGATAFRMAQVAPAGGTDLARLLVEPNTVLLPEGLARDLGIENGGSATLLIGEREAAVRVIGFVARGGADVAAEPPIVADVATAQELLGTLGRIDRIDLELTDEQARALAAAPPNGAVLVGAANEDSAFRQLTSAFRTNLSALGLLALVVGMFLIYGTMAFAILQRTQTLGILRTLGVSRGEILQTILWETAGIAAIATALGLVLGHVLAIGLVGLVLRTIGDLSFNAAVGGVEPSPWIYVEGAALGFVATLLAALKPALDAARITPAAALRRAVLERRAHAAARRAAYVALPILAASGLVLKFGPSELYAAFAGLFGVLAAGALLTPLATVAVMSALDRALARRAGIPVTLAVRGVSASLSRTGVATAALAVAVATVNGVGLMISSFRASLDDWLDTTLTADVYLSAVEDGALSDLVASGALEKLPGVEGLMLTRARVVPTSHGDVAIRAVRPGGRGFGLSLVAGDAAAAFAALADGTGVIASERLLFSSKLRVGADLEVQTPAGPKRLPIVGAFRDFNTGVPAIVMTLDAYRRDWGDFGLTGVGVDLSDDADEPAVEAAIRSQVGGAARLRSSTRIKELSLGVFDRTFKVTEVLRVLAGVVAFLGILSALLAIELERARELSVLRTLGFTPGGLGATLLTQTGLLGLAAGLAAAPIGAVLALLLVHVINRRSFGWTMEFALTPQALVSGVSLAVIAALLAGIYPAWRASRIELGAALRED
ncbi:MAG TPA: FtsX-like permease family protein [Gammaproteobacteria bacterium]